jgi:EAL domain-containing protein (putative c-di-GMP-specific phosphodiesterase class I)
MDRDAKAPPLLHRSNLFAATPFLPARAAGESAAQSIPPASLITAEDLSVVFQPIVRLDPLRIFAYEALVRCRLPEFRNPTVLFERAVTFGCTGPLGRMIREVAMPLCAGMPAFINVHPSELEDRWLLRPDDPMFLHDHDVYVEITEAVPFTHFRPCHDVLRELRSRVHMHLVVDDLGAGYSNLKSICDLEPKVVKLDRGVIAGTTSGSRQQKLVRAVVRLCEDLGAEVVAEGIETATELRALREAGIRIAQGYLFARPAFPLPKIDPAAFAI